MTVLSTLKLALRVRINEELAKSEYGIIFLQLNEKHRKSSTIFIVVERRSVRIRTKVVTETPWAKTGAGSRFPRGTAARGILVLPAVATLKIFGPWRFFMGVVPPHRPTPTDVTGT